jgi:LysM repeat protein
MKKTFSALVILALFLVPGARGQDAATEERLNQLSGKIEDLIAGQDAQRKRIAELAKELEALREQQSKPNGSYASQEDLKSLARSLKEVDQARVADNQKTRDELVKLGKILATPAAGTSTTRKKSGGSSGDSATSDKPAKDKDVAEYVVQSGDTLSVIAQAYKEKNVKVTVDQILKANPGLVAEKMHPGQKIYVPLNP